MKNKQALRRLEHVQLLIAHAAEPIVLRTTELATIDTKLADLKDKTCTGKVAWRDGKGQDKHSKMLIIHGTNQSCPLHGEGKPGGRIRSYVGTDPSKQMAAKHAIESESTRKKLQSKRDSLNSCISRSARAFEAFYDALGYTHPIEGQNKTPAPVATWIPRARYSRY